MDKLNFVRDGGSRLPPGFRFEPTEEELVFQYLAPKILSHSLPALVIPEIDNVFCFDPWDLPGEFNQDKYFFSNLGVSGSKGSCQYPTTCSGYWKVAGSAKQITCVEMTPMVGIRKSLVFYEGQHPGAVRTDWIIHEYDIAQKKNPQGSLIPVGNWTLCHIFLRKRDHRIEEVDNQDKDKPTGGHGSMVAEMSTDTESSSASSSSSPRCNSSIYSTEVTSFEH